MATPIDAPAGLRVTDCTLRPVNAVATQTSPFTFKQAVQIFPGQRWEMELAFLDQPPVPLSDPLKLLTPKVTPAPG